MVVRICHSNDSRKSKIAGSWFRTVWAKNKTLSPEKPEQKGLEVWLKQ
jgi:hypothetical protein